MKACTAISRPAQAADQRPRYATCVHCTQMQGKHVCLFPELQATQTGMLPRARRVTSVRVTVLRNTPKVGSPLMRLQVLGRSDTSRVSNRITPAHLRAGGSTGAQHSKASGRCQIECVCVIATEAAASSGRAGTDAVFASAASLLIARSRSPAVKVARGQAVLVFKEAISAWCRLRAQDLRSSRVPVEGVLP